MDKLTSKDIIDLEPLICLQVYLIPSLPSGDVRVFNIKSIRFIDDMVIIDGQSLCVDEIGVGIMSGLEEEVSKK
jgi:hypothetical protein